MNMTPEQMHAAIARLMLKSSAQELALAAMASLLSTEDMALLKQRIAALAAMQETVGDEKSTEMTQQHLQPKLDMLFGILEGAHRQFRRSA